MPLQPWLNGNRLHAATDLFIEDPILVFMYQHLLVD